jgi:hypothetical protein
MDATPDQLVTIGSVISREWGAVGYRIEDMHSYSRSVSAARVYCSDGGRFVVLASDWGQSDYISCEGADTERWDWEPLVAKAQALHKQWAKR